MTIRFTGEGFDDVRLDTLSLARWTRPHNPVHFLNSALKSAPLCIRLHKGKLHHWVGQIS